ncbi:MAG: N-acetylmuramoyl-L-alanine amidase [Flavobacteriaceae bacterium]
MQTKLKYLLVSFILLLTLAVYPQSSKDKFIVVLDAGHGGHDPGKNTKNYKEKHIALNIALKIGSMLEQEKDIKVIYTRKKDVFVELHERGAIANRADADLFVSIHCNAHDSQAYGSETWVLGTKRSETNFNVAKAENEVILLEDDYEKHYEGYDPNAPESIIGLMLMSEDYLDQSILLASYVQNNFENKLKRKNRGVKQEAFIVLHQTYMPSVLIETGFITNLSEGKYLSSDKGQTEMATSIKEAILKYRNSLNGTDDNLIIGNSGKVYSNSSDSEVYPDITFKVQIAASTRKLETKPYNFKGLSDISREQVNGVYKYYYGSTSNYNTIKAQKLEALEKGYSTCFIVAIKNGEQVPLSEALKN